MFKIDRLHVVNLLSSYIVKANGQYNWFLFNNGL